MEIQKTTFGLLVLIGTTVVTAVLAWVTLAEPDEPPAPCPAIARVIPPVVAPLPPPQPVGPPSVLFVQREVKKPSTVGTLERALVADGMAVTVVDALPDELAAYDVVLLSDMPMHSISDRVDTLDRYVASGGTLLVAGGEDSLGSGGYEATRLEQLMPVRFRSGCSHSSPDVALVVVVDSSAAMAGARLAQIKTALRGLPETLSPSDYFAVIAYGDDARMVVRPQRAAQRARIAAQLDTLAASGSTANLYAGVREAHAILDGVNATIKHVIVISGSPSAPDGLTELVQDMPPRVTVSAIGMAGSEQSALATVAGNGRLYRVDDVRALPRITTAEATEAQRRIDPGEDIHVHVAKHVPAIAGSVFVHAPPLHGYVTMQTKPAAETILMSSFEEPILAQWCHGNGRVITWTSDADGPWAKDWVRWPGYAEMWSQLVRASVRGRGCH